ncbi:hypothetical protein KHQ81_15825 (plasmid) [Mycoplasmatota bacterium]|nr:hypothetical protein KHQ81_15825 [Mycoplasmatota bacterium]
MDKNKINREELGNQLHEASMLALNKEMVKPIRRAFTDFPNVTYKQ